MAEDFIIQEDIETDVPPQQGDPLEKLYKGLVSDGKYTKSYDEFKKKYSSKDSIDFLYSGLAADKDYTKGKDEFYNQYFPSVKKKESFTSDPNAYLKNFGSGSPQSASNGLSQDGVGEPVDLPSTSNLKIQATDSRVGGDKSFNNEPVGGALKSIGKGAALGFGTGLANIPKGIAIMAKKIDLFNEYEGHEAKELATYRAGKWIDESFKDLFGELTPEEQKKMSVKLAVAGGNMATLMVGGLGAKALGASATLTTATMGALQQGTSEYENAVAMGATPDQASKAFWINAAIGTTDAWPMIGAFRKLDKYSGGLATGALAKKLASTAGGRIASDIATGFVVEAAQEAGQQILTNVTAKNTYDATIEIFDGVGESFGIGGIIGGTMRGVLSGIREKRAAGNLTPEEDIELAKAEKFAEEKIQQEKKVESNINHINKVKENVSHLPEKHQDAYVQQSLIEKLATEKAEKLTDPTLVKTAKEIAKESHEIKQQILAGKDPDEIVTEKQQKEIDEKEKTATELKRLEEDHKLAIQKVDTKIKDTDGRESEANRIKLKELNLEKERLKEDYEKKVQKLKKEVEPNEISQPIELSTELPEDFKQPEKVEVDAEVNIPNLPTNEKINAEGGGANQQGEQQPAQEGQPSEQSIETPQGTTERQAEEITPPIEPPPAEPVVEGGGDAGGITHAANEVRRQERKLPEYQKSPTTKEALMNEAEQKLKEGYDVEDLFNRMEQGETPEPVDNFIRKIYVATLDAEILKNPTDELLSKQKRFVELGDLANSKIGLNLWSLQGEGSPLSSISDFYVAKMQATGQEKLTDAQKEEVKKQYDDVKKTENDAEAKLLLLKEENTKLKAELALKKAKASAKKEKKDYGSERANLKQSIKDKWNKAANDNTLTAVPIPYAKQLFAIAPDVAKLMKSYVEEGVSELKDIVSKIHTDLKGVIDEVTEKDVHDIIAGEYNTPKPTRNELAAKLRDLKDEAYYLNKLEKLLKGEESKSEKEKQQRIQKITELREKIKDISDFPNEVKRAEEEMLGKKAKDKKLVEGELYKAEKELDAADEKERKQKIAEAEKERKLLEREFEKEKRDEQRKALKAKLDEARRIEKELSYRTPEEKALDAIIGRNKRLESGIREKIAKGDFETKKEVPFLENPELIKKYPNEYNAAIDAIKAKEDARHEFDIALLRDQMSRWGIKEKLGSWLGKTAGTVKAITTGIDDSAVAIQTYVSLLRRPRTGAKAVYEHFRQGFSKNAQKKFDRWLTILHSSSDFKDMKEDGLDVTEPTSLKEREKEEIFNNRFNGTVKIKGEEYKLIDAPLKPFERAFTTLGNVTRVTAYRNISRKYREEGYTREKDPELFKSLARRLNEQTGRGKVNEYVEQANKVVTLGIWSPKLMAAKFNMLGVSDIASLFVPGTKGYYRSLHPKERLAAIRDVAQFAATVAALSYGLAFMAGGEVDDDPLSSTFMDVKLPNGKSYNFTGGFSGYIRAIAQFATGKKHKDGKTIKINPLETGGRFFRGKTPPLTSAALNTASGKNFMGQPTTPLGEVVNLAPISVRGIVQQIQNDGASAFLTQGIPTFFGFNVKNEKDYQPKGQSFKIKDQTTFKESDATPEQVKSYEELRDKKIPEITEEFKKDERTLWVDVNGKVKTSTRNVSGAETSTWKEVTYKDLTQEQIKQLEKSIKTKASNEAKKQLFGEDQEEEPDQ